MGCTSSKPTKEVDEPSSHITPSDVSNTVMGTGGVVNNEAAKKIQKIFRAASYRTEIKKQRTWQVCFSLFYAFICCVLFKLIVFLFYFK